MGSWPQVFKSYAPCDTHTLMNHYDDGGGGEYPGLVFGRVLFQLESIKFKFTFT